MTTTSIKHKPRNPRTGRRELIPTVGAFASIVGGCALIGSFLIVPGPDVADVHDAGWAPGHLISAVAFGLLALGLPSIAGSLGRRLGPAGAVGYVALLARYILSTGSHLYSLWILPRLATVTVIRRDVRPGHPLASIYAGHGKWFDLVIALGMLGLVWALFRCGRGMRTITVFVALAAASEFLTLPFGLALLAVFAIWLGLRLLVQGDVLVPLRATRPAP